MTIEPTPKAPEVDNALTAMFGVDRRESIPQLKCLAEPIGCGKQIDPSAIECWGPSTRNEFRISGLCGPCQVEIMGGAVSD
jgi:hypothetical protein